ncbi:hypothetical protein PENTCL1PPCAC_16563, partial [Pristionchus entomophagus]
QRYDSNQSVTELSLQLSGRTLIKQKRMAEAEIILKEDDDLLKKITEQANQAELSTSPRAGWLRPRGSADLVVPRMRYPIDDVKVFDNCQHCNSPLGGCIEGEARGKKWTLVMSCGHVLCQSCKDDCRATRPETQGDSSLLECIICKEYGAANKLPGPDNVNLGSCQAAYCKGEVWTLERERCDTCQRNLCEGCKEEHGMKFPDHELTPRGNIIVDHRRTFTVCRTHSQSITSRCDCGEMVCDRCPYNYSSHIPDTERVQMHRKTRMEEVDLDLEDALEDTIGTISRIRSMRSIATQKKEELEEVTDRMANEVALHFNQIIIQTIQRCFDVLTSLKKVGSTHHSAIDNHLKMLDKTERQLTVGVEMDERARCPTAVKVERVSQYVRNVAYGLCKPAVEQFENSKAFSSSLASTQFSLTIELPDTRDIVRSIGRWGEYVVTNAEDLNLPSKQVRIAPTRPTEAVGIVNGGVVKNVLDGSPIIAEDVPLRLHSALDHFTDIFEKRFVSESMLMERREGCPRELPFQLGMRDPETGMDSKARHSYEREMMSRPGMYIHVPKIFGGYRRIYNLTQYSDMGKKDVQEVYSKTPCLAPIWMANGEDPTEITPLLATSDPNDSDPYLQQQQDRAVAAAARAESSSPSVIESRPATPHSAAVAADSSSDDRQQQRRLQPSPPTMQQPQQSKTVLRKKNLVFVRKDHLHPPQLEPEVPPRPPPPPYGSPAPSRLLGPSILRRPTPSSSNPSLHFRPATTADFMTAGVAPPPAAAAAPPPPKVLLRDQTIGQSPRLVRVFPKVGDGRPRFVRVDDPNSGSMRAFRTGAPAVGSPSMLSGRPGGMPNPSRGHPGYFIPGGSSGTGTPADKTIKQEIEDAFGDGGERSSIRVNTMRVMGTAENRYGERNMFNQRTTNTYRLDTPDEADRRKLLTQQGFHEREIDRIIAKARSLNAMSSFKVVVPAASRPGQHNVNPNHHRALIGPTRHGDAAGPMQKKRMLPIERAFTNMFGADGSIIPELSYRRRGRPSKDDPTAPSNIIEQFRKHTTQWPPKFEEMNAAEVAELQDLIDQLDDATRQEREERAEREEGEWPLFEMGVKSEEEEPQSPWLNYSQQERERIRAAAAEKIQGARTASGGCFVCALFRREGGKPRHWQCSECMSMGRELTPIREDEIVEPPAKRPLYEIRPPSVDEMEEGEGEEQVEEEEEEEGVDPLTALFSREEETPVVEKKVEKRGRPRKNREPVESPQPPPQQSKPKEPRKKREPIPEEAEPDEGGVVMGTTRRGRQIKMPSKLKGHEVTTASTTRRSPSETEEAMASRSSSTHSPAVSAPTTAPPTPRISPTKKKIKEETPEREPRSEMDGPKRGGRRRN